MKKWRYFVMCWLANDAGQKYDQASGLNLSSINIDSDKMSEPIGDYLHAVTGLQILCSHSEVILQWRKNSQNATNWSFCQLPIHQVVYHKCKVLQRDCATVRVFIAKSIYEPGSILYVSTRTMVE